MRLLGLDLGTTNVKAIVADENAQVVGRGSVSIETYAGQDGAAEQDLEQIWQATRLAIQQATATAAPDEIRAIGVSSQGGAMQWLDTQRRPIGRVISWLDGRGRPWDEANDRRLGPDWFAQRTGHRGSGLAIGQIQRKHRGPAEQGQKGHCLGFVGDLIVERLCGMPAHDATSAAMTLLCNPHRRDYDSEVLALIDVEPSQLPRILPADQPASGLLPSVAVELGLPSGTPVSPAVHDQYAAALGVGAIQPGQVMLGTGTAWVLVAMLDRWMPPVAGDAFVAAHVVDGLFGQLLALRNGGSSVSWVLRAISLEHREDQINELLERVPAGCDGLRCVPFLSASAPTGLRPGTSGSMIGLRLSHGPEHLLRAVIEGLGFEVQRHLGLLREAGLAPHQILMCGGAVASPVTPQIIADVTGVPVTCAAHSDGSLVGALMIARKLVEPGTAWQPSVEAMTRGHRLVEPGPDRTVYLGAYQDYLKLLAPFALPSAA